MKIGIGITTTPNRDVSHCVNMVEDNTPKDSYDLFIHNDVEFKGVAYSKNMCLYALRHCDLIFLFDDDCWPIDRAWFKYLIKAHNESHHYLYLNDRMHGFEKRVGGILGFRDCGGVFMSFSKTVIEKVGYMDSRYKGWGFEHAGYSNRIHQAGLSQFKYQMPRSLSNYIQSQDYAGVTDGSTTKEIRSQYYEHNRLVFLDEINSGIIYKEFKP